MTTPTNPTDLIKPFAKLSKGWKIASTLHLGMVGFINHLFTNYLNKSQVHNREKLLDLVHNRPKGTPLITVCNHNSCCDDPGVFGSLLPMSLVVNFEKLRWSFAAKEICFSQPAHTLFFRLAKGLPIIRGEGIYQPIMNEMLGYLNKGEWLHLFPEGKVNEKHEFLRLKWGVGRLISDCSVPPIVLPFYHRGFDEIMPNFRPYYPRIRKKITVVVGDPIDFSELLKNMREKNIDPVEMRKTITDIVQVEFYKLKELAGKLHEEHLAIDMKLTPNKETIIRPRDT